MFSERCASALSSNLACLGSSDRNRTLQNPQGTPAVRDPLAKFWKAIVRHLVAFDTKRILNDLGGAVGVVGADGALREGWSCRGHCSEPLSHYSNHRN
jgi:hypothetical protein